jgi:hypothetical protein
MEDPAARKQRLKALRAAAQANGDSAVAAAPQEAQEPTLKFRNYAVQDKKHVQHVEVGGGRAVALRCVACTARHVCSH